MAGAISTTFGVGTLTDVEIAGLHERTSLADGHAYHDLHDNYRSVIDRLPSVWDIAAQTKIPAMEQRLRNAFARLAYAPSIQSYDNFRVSPTASNSIDIVAAVARMNNSSVGLIEPTFDNLALLMKRRGVVLHSLSENDFHENIIQDTLATYIPALIANSIFVVNPNNPTGRVLDKRSLERLVDFCLRHNKTLLMDNSFRFFNREPYDDYDILLKSGVSFISFEDTGKIFPTLDLKTSIIFYSEDMKEDVERVYNEIYLCTSNVAMELISQFMDVSYEEGLNVLLWDLVDVRRTRIRDAISGSALTVAASATQSRLGVEWIDCSRAGTDRHVHAELLDRGLMVLPGRPFFWNSDKYRANHKYIRISLLKTNAVIERAIETLACYCNERLIKNSAFCEIVV